MAAAFKRSRVFERQSFLFTRLTVLSTVANHRHLCWVQWPIRGALYQTWIHKDGSLKLLRMGIAILVYVLWFNIVNFFCCCFFNTRSWETIESHTYTDCIWCHIYQNYSSKLEYRQNLEKYLDRNDLYRPALTSLHHEAAEKQPCSK